MWLEISVPTGDHTGSVGLLTITIARRLGCIHQWLIHSFDPEDFAEFGIDMCDKSSHCGPLERPKVIVWCLQMMVGIDEMRDARLNTYVEFYVTRAVPYHE
jgi:hypothetical protein